MAEHQPGSMDVRAQERVFAGFVAFVSRTVVVIVAGLVLLALLNG